MAERYDIPEEMKPQSEEELKKMQKEVESTVNLLFKVFRENQVSKPAAMIAYLYVILLTAGTSSDVVRRFEFPDTASCEQAIKSRLFVDNKKESTVVIFCANQKNQRHYGSTWWNEQQKDAN